MRLHEGVKDLLESRWQILFGDLEVTPQRVIELFCLLDAALLPLVLLLLLLRGALLWLDVRLRLKDARSGLHVLLELTVDESAENVEVRIE